MEFDIDDVRDDTRPVVSFVVPEISSSKCLNDCS